MYYYLGTNYCTVVHILTNWLSNFWLYDWLTLSVFAMWNITRVLWCYYTITDIILPKKKKDSNIFIYRNQTSDFVIDWLQVFLQCEIAQESYDLTQRLSIIILKHTY